MLELFFSLTWMEPAASDYVMSMTDCTSSCRAEVCRQSPDNVPLEQHCISPWSSPTNISRSVHLLLSSTYGSNAQSIPQICGGVLFPFHLGTCCSKKKNDFFLLKLRFHRLSPHASCGPENPHHLTKCLLCLVSLKSRIATGELKKRNWFCGMR